MKRFFVLFALFGYFYLCPSLFAQAIDSFSISAKPEYPAAGENTVITVDSYSIDLSRSKITWKENNSVVASDFGITEKTFIAPQNGESKTINVEVVTPAGYKITNSYTLTPQAVDLLWEAPDSWVPPFYKGKALASEQALVRVTAIPNFTQNGVLQDRNQTVYSWSVDGVKNNTSSGYNKSSFVFVFNPLKRGSLIKLVSGTLNNKIQTESTLSLAPTAPQILFYESSPLLGTLFERAFSRGLSLVTSEITLSAAPYYFSGADDLVSNNGFSWKVDNIPVNVGTDQTKISLKSPGKKGSTVVSLLVKSVDNSLQTLQANLPIVYEK